MDQRRTSKSVGTSVGYRSRYRAFLAQRNQVVLANGHGQTLKLGQGMINFAIFIALFIGILTLFGFGLSRLNRGARLPNENFSQSKIAPSTTSATDVSPPPAVSPSVHAEVKISASPHPMTTVELKKKVANK